MSTNGPLAAEVVEFASMDELKAAPVGSLNGKIAFVNLQMLRTKDGSGYGPASNIRRDGASQAAAKGAVAIVIRSVGTDSDRLPHTGMMRYEPDIAKIPAAALSVPDADLLANMLKRGKPVKIELNIDAGYTGSKTEYNVIGEITGRSRPNDVVVIGGHLDSWDLGTGAIDDGAGVAITMAAGAMIGKLKSAPKRTVRVIAFANEEQGLSGRTGLRRRHQSRCGAPSAGRGKRLRCRPNLRPACRRRDRIMAGIRAHRFRADAAWHRLGENRRPTWTGHHSDVRKRRAVGATGAGWQRLLRLPPYRQRHPR